MEMKINKEQKILSIAKDGLYCHATKALILDIEAPLEYKKQVVVRHQFGTKIKNVSAYMVDRRSGLFLRGLLSRVRKHLSKKGIKYTFQPPDFVDTPPRPIQLPSLKDITLREDQLRLIESVAAGSQNRGVIVSPTGSGKTIMALGIISVWPNAKSLILTHRLDILSQFEQRARQYLPDFPIQVLKKDNRDEITGQIICSTIQTMTKCISDDVMSRFDIIICDECHHIADRNGMFAKFLNGNLAPVKVGFTATPPTDRAKLLVLEGTLGPVIGELSIEAGQEKGIISKPFTTLVNVPANPSIKEEKIYKKIYDKGIVNNRTRNKKIIEIAKERATENKTSLIIVKEIPHGDNLYNMAKLMKLKTVFVRGSTASSARLAAKKTLQNKTVDCVICTDVWREGIDIPSLDCIIMAYGGKSKIQTLQGVGRGLRTFKGKDRVEVVDFLDPYKYLAQHTIERLQVYVEQGWMGN